MNFIDTTLLAVIEGITEFIPVSSTGHMVIASYFRGISEDEFVKAFQVIIQFGAILSVLTLYAKKIYASPRILFQLVVAFIPTGIIGLLLKKQVDVWLESLLIVVAALFVGGIILVFVDRWFKNSDEGKTISGLRIQDLLLLGLIQSLAIIPGVSRSAATIIGGLSIGMKRSEAVEFSFLLALPTLGAAGLYKLIKIPKEVLAAQWIHLVVGSLIAFVVALAAMKFLIKFIQQRGFAAFGYYRIALSVVLLIIIFTGTR